MQNNMESRVVLIGKGSMISKRLGADLTCNSIATSSRYGESEHFLDLSNFKGNEAKFINEKDTVIISAAISSPDRCIAEYELAKSINVTGTRKLIAYCLNVGARVIFLSSDSVYGDISSDKPISEAEPLRPLGNYAEMKAEIEDHFSNSNMFIALRLSYVISYNDKYTKYLSSCIKNQNTAEIYHPFYRNSFWIGDLVDLVSLLLGNWPSLNSLNVGGPNLVSRIEMAKAYMSASKSVMKYNIVQPNSTFYNARPAQIPLNINAFTNYLGRKPYNLKTAYEKELKLQL